MDWARLEHAYGSAEDVPGLLARLRTRPDAELWSELWSALCHQGSVYSASFAVLPWLTAAAKRDDRDTAVNAVLLAASIVAGSDRPWHRAARVRDLYRLQLARLREATERWLPGADGDDYPYLLDALVVFEGAGVWGGHLAWCLAGEGFDVECPACGEGIRLPARADGTYVTIASGESAATPIVPVDPAALTGLGRRLYERALGDGRAGVAEDVAHLFGTASCPTCGAGFPVADGIRALVD